jgi:hypothetical protein
MCRELRFNADFDLALHPGWRPALDPGLAAQVRQLELHGLLAAEPDRRHGWVATAEHDNAALGNRRLHTPAPDESKRRWLAHRPERTPMVLERWLPRELDLSVVFEVGAGGAVGPVRVHETVTTSAVGFIGALPTSPLWVDTTRGHQRPRKLGLLYRAASREAVLAMHTRIRARLER